MAQLDLKHSFKDVSNGEANCRASPNLHLYFRLLDCKLPYDALQQQLSASPADLIMHGLDSGRFEIVFPRRMAVAMKLLRVLPYAVVFRITRRMVKGSRV